MVYIHSWLRNNWWYFMNISALGYFSFKYWFDIYGMYKYQLVCIYFDKKKNYFSKGMYILLCVKKYLVKATSWLVILAWKRVHIEYFLAKETRAFNTVSFIQPLKIRLWVSWFFFFMSISKSKNEFIQINFFRL